MLDFAALAATPGAALCILIWGRVASGQGTQGNGKIFAGSWADSRWKGREVEIPQEMLKKISADGSRTIAAVPGLRPGCVVNASSGGDRVETVTMAGIHMRFKCKQS